jgi:hypothetical protein
MLRPYGVYDTTDLNHLAFQSFDYKRHMMKVIPETCCGTTLDIYIFYVLKNNILHFRGDK